MDQANISAIISVDGTKQLISLPIGSTVQAALEIINLTLGQLDRVEPPMYSTLTDGSEITITRVREEYETQQYEIPFEIKELANESMTEGEIRLVQAGENGTGEKSIRRIYEDNILVNTSIIANTVTLSPVPEILMVGIQNPFITISIPGRLVYLSSGNAWLMETSTANRYPLVTSGDLDGRIFSLSPDGMWLLYSRKSSRPEDQEINTLWVINVIDPNAQPLNLHVTNVVHFADWQPGDHHTIAYSTVEPRASAPGWQANNDLFSISFDVDNSKVEAPLQILESSSGGIYGWWGMSFAWSPDGSQLAYARPDEIGLVDFQNKILSPLVEITPLNTFADWAWIPGITWSSDNTTLFFVTHSHVPGLTNAEESPYFDLEALSITTGVTYPLIPQVGMFAYPSSSHPSQEMKENVYRIICLKAIFPLQSSTSRYRLLIMDGDGSEQNIIFPSESRTGIMPQSNWSAWAPENGSQMIALIYEGNLWIINTLTGDMQQVTGDGLTTQLDWK